MARRKTPQAGEIECEQIAALRRRDGVQLVEYDALQVAEELSGRIVAEQQRKLFWRREKNVWRLQALTVAPRDRRIARARFDLDG